MPLLKRTRTGWQVIDKNTGKVLLNKKSKKQAEALVRKGYKKKHSDYGGELFKPENWMP